MIEDNLFDKIKKLMHYFDSKFDVSNYKTLESFDFYNVFDTYGDNLLTCVVENYPIEGVKLNSDELLYIISKTDIKMDIYIKEGVNAPAYLIFNSIRENNLPCDEKMMEYVLKNSGHYSLFGHKINDGNAVVELFRLEKDYVLDKQLLKDILLSVDLNIQDDDGLTATYYSMRGNHLYGFDITKFLVNNTTKEINDIYFDNDRYLEQYTSICEENVLRTDIIVDNSKKIKAKL